MSDIIPNLKTFINNFIENRQFTKITTGVILSTNPLRVKLNNEIILESDMVAPTWKNNLDSEYIGESVHLIRQDKGGFYYILYKEI